MKISIKNIKNAIKNETYAIIVNHISNVLGVEQDIEEIGKLAKENNLLFIVDTAQSGGHKQIDMKKDNISILAFAGHKGLLGLSGVGGIIANENVSIKPIKFGGTGTSSEDINQPVDMPEGFESGTLPFLNIVALQNGVKYVQKNFDTINKKIEDLTKYLLDKLKLLKNIILYTPTDCYNGVVAFNVKNYPPSRVSDILNEKYKICVRSGLACAPYVHRYLNTLNGGVVRVSIAHYNTKRQINKLIKALSSLE